MAKLSIIKVLQSKILPTYSKKPSVREFLAPAPLLSSMMILCVEYPFRSQFDQHTRDEQILTHAQCEKVVHGHIIYTSISMVLSDTWGRAWRQI